MRGLAAAVVVATTLGASADNGVWPTEGHDPQRTGYTSAYGPSGPNVGPAWSYISSSAITGAPVIGPNNQVYVLSQAQQPNPSLYMLSGQGVLVWSSIVGPGSTSPALLPNGNLVVGTWQGYLWGVSGSGGVPWAIPTNGSMYGSPTMDPVGNVYVGSAGDAMFSVNPMGTMRWTFPTYTSSSAAALSPAWDMVYFGCGNGYVYALSATTGASVWAASTGIAVTSTPAVDPLSGNVYLGGADGLVHCLQGHTGAAVWVVAGPGAGAWSSPAVSAGIAVVLGNANGGLYAYAPATGQRLWTHMTKGAISHAAAIDGNSVAYVGCSDGFIYAVDCTSGTLVWKHGVGAAVTTSPVIGLGNTLVVVSGQLITALVTTAGSSSSPKVEVAVGTSVGAAAVLGLIAVVVLRRRRSRQAVLGSKSPLLGSVVIPTAPTAPEDKKEDAPSAPGAPLGSAFVPQPTDVEQAYGSPFLTHDVYIGASRVLSDRPTSHVCTVCATSNAPDVAYCRSCGASLKARVHS